MPSFRLKLTASKSNRSSVVGRISHRTRVLLPVIFSPFLPSRRFVGLLTFSLASLASASYAAPKTPKLVGVRAWTSGNQTFIRARPGANVPPVAKVPRHTPLYVWGKYNGWYRVETHDHIFGWVFNPYISAPAVTKVSDLSRTKARSASNRTANQTMYGTPDVLKKHFLTYGAPGALRGLKKQGVYLAIAPKPKAEATKPRLAITPKLRPRVAALMPRRVERVSETGFSSPVPTVEKPRLTVAPRVPQAAIATPSVRMSAPVKTAMTPRSLEVGQIAGASRDLVPSARSFARGAGEAASQNSSDSAPISIAAKPVAAKPVEVKPVEAVKIAPVESAPVYAEKSAPRVVAKPAAKPIARPRVVAAPKVSAKAKKASAKAAARKRYTSAKARQRDQLRLRMGLSPAPMPPTVIAPVSPAELLRARQQYLSERKARLNPPTPQSGFPQSGFPAAPPADAGTPVGNLAPLPPPTGPLGGPSSNALPPTPPALQPMAYEGETDLSLPPLYPILADPRVVALSQIRPKAPVGLAPFTVAPRGLVPLYPTQNSTQTAPNALRGGSPRDRFGSGMANQALSYRGMRYIRGAASPSRGFDCSGLVYYLLRQRGYNPPRTAAGYRNWGAKVTRGALAPGDLLLFANTYKRGISHIGVYLGENKFVHAATSGTGVRVSSLGEKYYAGKYFGARRAKRSD